MRNGVVDKQTVDGLTILVLAGELDLSAVSALRRELISSAAETLDIVIDLRRVTFMDCSTIGAFVMLNNHVRANGGSLQLTRVAPGQLRLLTLCQLIRALRVRDTLQGATAAAHGSHDRQYVS